MSDDPQTRDAETQPDPLVIVGRFIREPANANVITAIATVAIFLSGLVYTIVSFKQWRANEDAANAARSAAETAKRTLEMADRPWLKPESIELHPVEREWDKTKPWVAARWGGANGQTLWTYYRVQTKNIGKSAAIAVQLNTELFLVKAHHSSDQDVRDEEERFCKSTSVLEGNLGAIFPEDVRDDTPMDNGAHEAVAGGSGDWAVPLVIGCVHYRYTNSFEPHETRFIYQILRKVKDMPYLPIGHEYQWDELTTFRPTQFDYAN